MVKNKKALKTVVSFILDNTGSMESIKDATISGFNEYIKGLKKQGNNLTLTLTTFNSEKIETPYVKAKLSEVKELTGETYQPDNLTPLYDAVCRTVKNLEKEIKKDEAVIVAIMTDGLENNSKEYTQVQMREIIKRLEKKGNWTFAYLGANQDSYAVAQQYGIKIGNIKNWEATPQGASVAMNAMSIDTASFAASNSRGVANTSNFFSGTDDKEDKE